MFHRRGSFGRAKYRIRRYGDSPMIFLERKLRQPGVLIKRRTQAPLDVLEHDRDACEWRHWPGSWFDRRVAARRLEPSAS